MKEETLNKLGDGHYTIDLRAPIYICFIPFSIYSEQSHLELEEATQKQINADFEKRLTGNFDDGKNFLLNVQNNKNRIK